VIDRVENGGDLFSPIDTALFGNGLVIAHVELYRDRLSFVALITRVRFEEAMDPEKVAWAIGNPLVQQAFFSVEPVEFVEGNRIRDKVNGSRSWSFEVVDDPPDL